jgi:hypothetical protein
VRTSVRSQTLQSCRCKNLACSSLHLPSRFHVPILMSNSMPFAGFGKHACFRFPTF